MKVEKVKQLKKEIISLLEDSTTTVEELHEIGNTIMDLEIIVSDKYENLRDMMMH